MALVDPEQRVGTVLGGRYRIDRFLGKGGMGVVLAGTHELTDRRVAIKLLLPDLARDADVLARFFQEAKAAAGLDHPNVVDTLDMGVEEDTGQPYLVLELLDGEDLAHRLQRNRPMEAAALLPIVLPVIDALAAAHEHGIVHRDLKPENIFIAKDARGRPISKVLDFGIAKLIEGESAVTTRAGGVLGTPTYMSPEQAMGASGIGPPSDVWSMGVVLYECLGGRVPFAAETLTGVLMQICTVDPPPLLEVAPFVHPAIAAVVGRAMQRTVGDRIQTMAELGSELTAAAELAGIELPSSVAGLFETSGTPSLGPVDSPVPIELVRSSRPGRLQTELLDQPDAFAATKVDARVTPLPEAPARRGRLALAAGGLVAVAVAAALLFWFLQPAPTPSDRTSAPADAPLAPPPGAVEPTPSEPHVVRVESEPEGAVAWRGEEELGPTPLAISVAPNETVELELRLAEHEPAQVTLSAESPPTRRVRLSPSPARDSAPIAVEETSADEGTAALATASPEDPAEDVAEAPAPPPAVARPRPRPRRGGARETPPARPAPSPAPSPPVPESAETQPVPRRTTLDTSRGQILVRARGGWAEVFHGARSLGRTPVRASLPVGNQRLRVVPYGTEPARSVNVGVEWGAVAEVVVDIAPPLPPVLEEPDPPPTEEP